MKVKTKTQNNDWIETLNNIENIISKEHIDNLSKETLCRAKRILKNKKAILSFSAGKDSIVLEHLLRPLGLASIMAYCYLEYPEFISWVKMNKPQNCELINSGQDLEWLSKNQEMLFPDNSKKASRWYDIVQHKVQNKYVKENNIECLVLGRRNADGNNCGQEGSYMKGNCLIYNPLYNWSHEEILAYLHYNKLELPPIYKYPNGYKQGTHNWASYRLYDGETIKDALDRLYKIDKNIIIQAKDYIPEIRSYYENYKNEN